MPRKRSEPYFPELDEDRLDNLRNTTMSDRALLVKLKECEDKDGLIDPADVAELLRIQATDHRTPAGTVSIRLSWMRRYQMIERVEPRTLNLPRNAGARYVITPFGEEVRTGKIPANVMRTLEKASLGVEVAIMGELTRRGFNGNGNGMGYRGRVLRRQFQNASGTRNDDN